MKSLYPVSFDSLQTWAAENNIPPSEAGVRFAQYAILRAIASSRILNALLVFKGGNALDFVWQANRSTRDLDFSMDMVEEFTSPPIDTLRELLPPVLRTSTQLLGVMLHIHRIEQQPPGPDKTFITYQIPIGYALPGETKLRARMEEGRASTKLIPVDVSLNEPICADEQVSIDANHRLRVSTIEDIVAEKLRALLQQPIRNRTRRQDLLDISVILRTRPDLDRRRVEKFLIEKARARNVPVSRAAFRSPAVAERARQDYAELAGMTRVIFVPFDDALQALYALVEELDIPDEGEF
ncbi:MAG: nucleotidyl transferase AbiEii/AbiGii toxin family protein [Chloroflexota bacterium]